MNRRQVAALKWWLKAVAVLYALAFWIGLLSGYWSAK